MPGSLPIGRRRPGGNSAYLLVALVTASLGLVAGIALGRAGRPDVLDEPRPLGDLPVVLQKWDDARPGALTVTFGAPRLVMAPRSGVLTQARCSPGGSLTSGSADFAIDGRPALTLALSTPLWRDLSVGTTGPDAEGMNTALRALGRQVSGNVVTKDTISAYDAVAQTAGAPPSGGCDHPYGRRMAPGSDGDHRHL